MKTHEWLFVGLVIIFLLTVSGSVYKDYRLAQTDLTCRSDSELVTTDFCYEIYESHRMFVWNVPFTNLELYQFQRAYLIEIPVVVLLAGLLLFGTFKGWFNEEPNEEKK
jgi:hypothetical protein